MPNDNNIPNFSSFLKFIDYDDEKIICFTQPYCASSLRQDYYWYGPSLTFYLLFQFGMYWKDGRFHAVGFSIWSPCKQLPKPSICYWFLYLKRLTFHGLTGSCRCKGSVGIGKLTHIFILFLSGIVVYWLIQSSFFAVFGSRAVAVLQERHIKLRLRNKIYRFSSCLQVSAIFFYAVSFAIVEFINVTSFECLSSPLPLFTTCLILFLGFSRSMPLFLLF